ncbi:MAG: von Willebrand factor type A domain-containing protein, partial [Bacteroidetes bacterium]|nr:von Willebrand factor type A domain-containing protein [Bacteroidota bacterium]
MKRILLTLTPLFLLVFAFKPATTFTVNGKITDDAGNIIAGASVVEKGTRTGASSNTDGTYKLTISNPNATLVFSAVGYEAKEIKVKGKPVIDVVLKLAKAELNEVVVVGYGTARKKDVTGSVATLSSPAIYGSRSNYYSNALVGKVAGVSVTNNNGYYDQKQEDFNTEGYDNITENRFLKVSDNPLSTFSIDVDAASYSNVRRFLNMGQLPPAGAVRIEEMINYFHYNYPQPKNADPFSINTEIADCPWNSNHKLVLIGLQGKKIPAENLPASNLTFLIDVSGSMYDANKLPLVKASMKMLVDQLREQDKVSIVVYAGAAGLVLPPTSGEDKQTIKDAIDKLEAGGSTAGGAGIKLAYKTAEENFVKGGNNRVILCTDGDFNIGASSDDEMERLIEQE